MNFKKNKKQLAIYSGLFLLGIFVFLSGRIAYVYLQSINAPFIPKMVTTILYPPKGALTAQVTNVKGGVKKEGRQDTDFKPIQTATNLVEGEALATDATGSASVLFSKIITVKLEKNSEFDYLNGLPQELVVRQPTGTITYTTDTSSPIFSIRSLGLLTQLLTLTQVSIQTDTTENTVRVKNFYGKAILAYSDSNNNTQVVHLSAGKIALFNYNNYTLRIY